ncbi:alanine racemase [Anaerosporomusa subterranea]|uniref:Alanine racemase n=1 Tax=Anaerosporomusa subterranea TaxID=1794912 RepID=A0A154BMN0_ANASB|nr:alanine racemase [Anaerosporomusa subterranea]KYZ75229.1 alanine racemase [Anaerosporomusa subterranea]
MRPTIAYVDLAAIRHNMSTIRKAVSPTAEIIAVVKANAYGHGAVPVSKAVLASGADSLAVAIPEEGGQLRQAGITAPILILGLSLPEEAPYYVEQNLTATVSTIEGVMALSQAARQLGQKANLMVKLDTGMGRIGLLPAQAFDFIQTVSKLPEIELRGIMTHLASADAADKTSAYRQLAVFEQLGQTLRDSNLSVPVLSAANSATIIDLPAGHLSAVRPGIILYGLPPSEQMKNQLDLQPAMEFKTKIVYIKRVPKGTPVSYGGTYTTTKDVYLATLPIGYADGYSRHLSNKASVLINGKRRQLVGRVCMDQVIVELGETCDASIGDEVVLFGRQGSEEITVTELAGLAGTINYELVCAVSQRVPRVYLNE